MDYEVERKFRLPDVEELVDRVVDLGGEFSAPQFQSDAYYAHPVRDFGETDEALRIRSVGTRNLITYKGPRIDDTTKTRRELELPLMDGTTSQSQWHQLLESLGFHKVKTVRKQRRHARLNRNGWDVAVDLDAVDGLGDFVELEIVVAESDLDSARACIAELAGTLGLSLDERRSYLELLLDK